MSRSKNQELRFWKAVLVQLRRVETTWRGHVLSRVDHATFTEACLMNAMVLHDLSLRDSGLGTLRDHVAWAHCLVHTDVHSLALFLSAAIDLLRDCSSPSRTVSSYVAFKQRLCVDYPFTGDLLAPIKGAIEGFLEHPSAARFYLPYQVLSFMTHLTLINLDQGDELEDEYCEVEDQVRTYTPHGRFIEDMNSIMKEWFRDFTVEQFQPQHGPGAVRELVGDRSVESKYRLIKPDALISYVFRQHASEDASTFCPPNDAPTTCRETAIIFVPKSMKTKRVISKEPATLMYFQQGVDRCIRRYIRRHHVLSSHIDLDDQCVQREIAQSASRSRSFATVDLSAASDRISYGLVKRVFHGTPLYPFLVALRSRTAILPSGRTVGMAKFAPMGSALCFPIQTLIFACIVECTLRYVRYDTAASSHEYHIYGDDIIVPDRYLHDVVASLRLCGLRINESKTFGGDHRFRESCGLDAYDGISVTCMKIGRRFISRQVTVHTPSVFAGLITMANAAYRYEFHLLRRYIVDKLVNETVYTPLFSDSVDLGIFSPEPSNYRLKRRWNVDYQVEEIKAACVLGRQAKDLSLVYDDPDAQRTSDDYRYFEWLRRSRFRDGDVFDPSHRLEVYTGSTRTSLRKRWRNTSFLTVGYYRDSHGRLIRQIEEPSQ